MTETQNSDSSPQRWGERRFAAFVVRALIFIVPLIAGFAAGVWVSRMLPEPDRVSRVVIWWVLTIATASAAATVVDRFARRFLPLSTLLKMSMLFPDDAPSRLKVARRSGSMSELKRRIASVESGDRAAGEAAELILSLAAALGRHDRKTRGHSERVRAYVDMIAEQLGLGQGDRDRLRWAALLHDIGKLEISGDILNKDGALDEDEWHEIRQHPIHGVRMIAPIVGWLGPWAQTIEHHHERYDGSGYPYGLAGEDIAYGARIVAVADAYDVMTSGRSYQRAMSAQQARKEVVSMAGTQFDPKVARALMKVALGRLRWATGPLAALGQFPFSRGLPALGRDVITLAASSALMATSLVTGVVNSPADLPTREILEVVIAGAGLSGSAIDAIVGGDDVTVAAGSSTEASNPTQTTSQSSTTTPSTDSTSVAPTTTTGLTVPTSTGVTTTTRPATTTTANTAPSTTTTAPATTTTRPPTTTTTRPPTTTTTTPPTTTTTAPPTTTTTTPPTTTTTVPATTTTSPPVVVAVNDSAQLRKNDSAIIRVLSNDSGPVVQSSVVIVSQASNGTASILGGSGQVKYQAGPNFVGTDSFSYQVCDAAGNCDTATVRLTVG